MQEFDQTPDSAPLAGANLQLGGSAAALPAADPAVRMLGQAVLSAPGSGRPARMLREIFEQISSAPGLLDLEAHVLQPGERLIAQGAPVARVYLLLEGGTAKVTKSSGGATRDVALIRCPNIVGEMSLYTGGRATADVSVGAEPIRALSVAYDAFQRFTEREGGETFREIVKQRFAAQERRAAREWWPAAEAARAIGGLADQVEPDEKLALQALSAVLEERFPALSICKRAFRRGELIVSESESGGPAEERDAFVLLPGSKGAVFKRSACGDLVYVGDVGPGSLVGEMHLLHKQGRRSASVQSSADPAACLEIPACVMRAALERPGCREALQRLFERRAGSIGLALFGSGHAGLDLCPDGTSAHSDAVSALSGSTSRELLERSITEINLRYPGGRPERAWEVSLSSPHGLVVFGADGRLRLLELKPETAREVLADVKVSTDLDHDGPGGYRLRQRCLHLDQSLTTHDAYTFGTLARAKSGMKEGLAAESKWLPERAALHEQLFEARMSRLGGAQSERGGQPVLVLMRGNTASGKSTLVRGGGLPRLAELGVSLESVINPDDTKAALRTHELREGRYAVTHAGVHTESAVLTERMIAAALERGWSFAIDKRFGTPADLDEAVRPARERGYRVVIVDLDAELRTSLDRVFGDPEKGIVGRDPDRADPIPSKSTIMEGFEQGRKHRREIAEGGFADEYYLLKSDLAGATGVVLMAKRVGVGAELEGDTQLL